MPAAQTGAGLRSEIPAPDPAKERAREVVQSPNNLSVKRLVLLSNTAKCHFGTPLARKKYEKNASPSYFGGLSGTVFCTKFAGLAAKQRLESSKMAREASRTLSVLKRR